MPPISIGSDATNTKKAPASTTKTTKLRLHAGANSSSFGSAMPRSTHSIREATNGTRLGRPPAPGASPGLKAPASLLRELIKFPFERTWSPQPKVPAAISVENRWLPRAHRELVFSSRGRRHAARPITERSPEISGKAASGVGVTDSNRHVSPK